MKSICIYILFFTSCLVKAQSENINIQNSFGAAGYDLVSYFEGKASKGSDKYLYTYEGIDFRFSSNVNLDKFKNNSSKYLPQYGGWCAYAMATTGKKVTINPKRFEVRDAKLFLFYDAYFNNTYEEWIEEGPEKLKIKADKNWIEVLKRNSR